ncbi:MAG: YidC/Oxa1 family membrane protein insertase [Acidimicrobiia bacterium]|nr:MAG: YidC/Oxa1 family membrane protein insertase [Acidimicrobiia bacterium]
MTPNWTLLAIPIWDQLVDFLGASLNFFYQFVPNLGIAIMLLTLALSLLLFPLTLKQTRSMRAMSEIQPEVKRLQKELKGNREELNKQLMALYSERGVNPAAGCLPLIVQMPIWFALFRVLRATDTYIDADTINTNFLGMDLTLSPSTAIPDAFSGGNILGALPYVILLIIIVSAGFYQQYQTTRTRSTDDSEKTPQQQSMQTAMKVMPLFFGFISWTLTAGLGIYFATSSSFRIGQQSLIFWIDGREQGTGESADPAGLPEGDEPAKGPSVNTSKKKKGRRRK